MEEEQAVLRISVNPMDSQSVLLEVEGKLVGPWVDELRRLSESALTEGKSVKLDLAKLLYVDFSGVALLRDLAGKNVTCVNCSSFVRQQVKEAAL